MKVRDVLSVLCRTKGPGTASQPSIAGGRLGLTEWGDKKVQALSKGMSQKVQFIATIVSRPELVLLDEPFSDSTRQRRGVAGSRFSNCARRDDGHRCFDASD